MLFVFQQLSIKSIGIFAVKFIGRNEGCNSVRWTWIWSINKVAFIQLFFLGILKSLRTVDIYVSGF
jgi:hypothetical protein